MRYKALPPSLRGADVAVATPRPQRPETFLGRWISTLLVVLLVPVLLLPTLQAGAATSSSYLIIDRADLLALPTSGSAWQAVVTAASSSLSSPDLCDQNDKTDVMALAAGLVYARTGQVSYADKVRDAIATMMPTQVVGCGNAVLALGRQLAGWVMAADLIDLKAFAPSTDATFRNWLSAIRTKDIGGHPRWYALDLTSGDSANNWGLFATASRIAADRYLGDTADLATTWAVFKGYTDGTWPFHKTSSWSSSWSCLPTLSATSSRLPIAIDGSCASGGYQLDGVPVEDASRSAFPVPSSGYMNEAVQGLSLSALLLARAGYPAFSTGRDAILRVAQAIQRYGDLNGTTVARHTTWIVDAFYGAKLPTVAASYGRSFGFTDWLYGSGSTATAPAPAPTQAPTPTPTPKPTSSPTVAPTPAPTIAPTATPSPTAPAASASASPVVDPVVAAIMADPNLSASDKSQLIDLYDRLLRKD